MRNLPDNLQILHFDTFALHVADLHFVPDKLQYLHLSAGALGNARVSHLPDTLTYLSLTTEEDQTPLPIVGLPRNLETLELHGNYNPPGLGDLFPPTLKSLSLGYRFTESLDSLPPHLRVLETGATFNRRLPALPPTLRYFKCLNNDAIDLSLPKFPPRYTFFLPLPLFILPLSISLMIEFRLFHVRSSKDYEELPPTCHKQPDHATYACSWCDELRGEHDYLEVFGFSSLFLFHLFPSPFSPLESNFLSERFRVELCQFSLNLWNMMDVLILVICIFMYY